MAIRDDNVEEKQRNPVAPHSSNGFADEKPVFNHKEAVHADAHEAAERGHAATDK